MHTAGKGREFFKGLLMSLPAAASLPMLSVHPSQTPTPIVQPMSEEPSATRPHHPTEKTPPPATTTAPAKTDNFVARVLFSETASCSDQERQLVASVMKNRIGNKAFGGASNMRGVAQQPKAFSAVNDPENSNWTKTAHPENMNAQEKAIWAKCLALSGGDFKATVGSSGRPIVYYHDKSVTLPDNWKNKYWTPVKEQETGHFMFYSVIPTSR